MKLPRLLLLVALFIAPRIQAADTVRRELVNGILVEVNGSVITFQDVLDQTHETEALLAARFASQPSNLVAEINSFRQATVERMVQGKLILQEFKTLGYQIPERYVQDQVEQDIKTKFGGNRLTLIQTLRSQGITYESYCNSIEEMTIIEMMHQKFVPPSPPISPAKIESYYRDHLDEYKLQDQIKLRTIFLNRTDVAAAKRLADEIRTKIITDGVAFDEMARIFSDGSQKSEGGDWKWIERGVLQTNLANIAFALKPGELSQPIIAQEGIYLMLVEGASPAHTRPLAEVREQIEETLKSEKRLQLKKDWIDRLRAKSFIRYNPA